jgi:CheY-like chemotaxis protein
MRERLVAARGRTMIDEIVQQLSSGRLLGGLLVLPDLNIPRLDGYELACLVRGHEAETRAPRIPILALAATFGSCDSPHRIEMSRPQRRR